MVNALKQPSLLARAHRLIFGFCLFVAGASWADEAPNPYLQQAIELYQIVKYELCVQRLEQAGQWKNQPAELVQIEIYAGLCQFNLNHVIEARAHFEMALRLNRSASLPPYSPPRAVSLFAQLVAELPPAPDAPTQLSLVPEPKPEQPVLIPTQPQRETSVVVPFSLGAASLASAAGGTALLVHALELARKANEEPFESRAIALGNDARVTANWSYVLFGLAGAAATGAVVSSIIAATD